MYITGTQLCTKSNQPLQKVQTDLFFFVQIKSWHIYITVSSAQVFTPVYVANNCYCECQFLYGNFDSQLCVSYVLVSAIGGDRPWSHGQGATKLIPQIGNTDEVPLQLSCADSWHLTTLRNFKRSKALFFLSHRRSRGTAHPAPTEVFPKPRPDIATLFAPFRHKTLQGVTS